MGTITGICTYHGEDAQDIPDLKHVRGVLWISGSDGKVHCFRKAKPRKRKDAAVVTKGKIVMDPVPVPASETQQQASELWASASKKDSGDEDVWIFGTVTMWDQEEGYGFVRSDENGTDFYTHRTAVAADEFNRRFLVVGEFVTFITKKGHSAEHGDLNAGFVKPIPRVDFNRSAPIAWREEFTVARYDPVKGTGRLERVSDPTARWIYFTRDDIITSGSVYPGARFWCGFRRWARNQDFRAHSIAIIKE